jgi:hypothetical protein
LEVVGKFHEECGEPGGQFGDVLQIHQHFY